MYIVCGYSDHPMAVFVFKIRNIVYLFIVLKIKYYISIPYLKSESNITNRKLDIFFDDEITNIYKIEVYNECECVMIVILRKYEGSI